MNPSPQPRAATLVGTRLLSAATAAGVALLLAGCPPAQERPAFGWRTAAAVRPIIPVPFPADDPALPDVDTASRGSAPPNLQIVLPRPVAPRSRVQPQPANSVSEGGKEDGPLIVPQVSAGESAAAQQEIHANLSSAERNLEAVRGRSLNATQIDMANKTRGFIDDAREAVQAGDWSRARSLAKKAQVLSEELARSL